MATTYQYDPASQLTRLVHQLGVTTIDSFDYTYDRVGNRRTKVDRNGSYNYTYDALNRLVQATNPLPSNPLETYQYDPVGNRANSNQNGASIFNQANQLTEDGSFTYQYDANGNLTRKTARVGGAFTNYEYDAENKLVRVVTPGKTVNYRYDGLGRRVEKEIVEVITTVRRYVYDNEDILLELDGSNNILSRFTHGPSIDDPLVLERSAQSFFYHADGLGSITDITNASGVVVQRYTYSSFGKVEAQLDPSFIQPFTYTAREFDPETNLYFYRERYYDPVTGRFLQEDRLGIDPGWLAGSESNQYVYVTNDPVSNTDPFGLFKLPADPSGLPQGWKRDPTAKRGETYTNPQEPGRRLVFEKGDPTSSNPNKQKNHWHDIRPGEKKKFGRRHSLPGEEVPEPGSDLRRKPGRKPPLLPVPIPIPTLFCPIIIINPCLIEPSLCGGGPSA